jgi:gliding motility-associated-like protein
MKNHRLILLLCFITLKIQAQNTVWRGQVVGLNGYSEPPEQTCSIVQNGEAHIAPNLSSIGYYWTWLAGNVSVCTGRNFTFEVRLKNAAAEGGISAFDTDFRIFGNGTAAGAVIMGEAWGQPWTQIYVGANAIQNRPELVMPLDTWKTIRMEFLGDTVNYMYDGANFFSMPYTTPFCSIDSMALTFKGSGAVDYIRIYDANNQLLWQEEFNDCNQFTGDYTCNQALNVSPAVNACTGQNINMAVQGNFSANTNFAWTGPNNFSSNSQNPAINNATSGNSGNYTVVVTDHGCPLPATTTQVTVQDCPSLSVSGNANHCGNSTCTPLAANLTITPATANIDGAKVYFNTGYVTGQDVLQFTPQFGITGTFDATTGVLSLNGNATATQYQQVLQSVCYFNSSATPAQGNREIYFVLGSLLYNAANGHYYQLVNYGTPLSWQTARNAAAASSYFGMQGYLVTVTNAQENTFLSQLINQNTWMGATDETQEGVWRWVTGCEGMEEGGMGRHFYTDATTLCNGPGGTPVGGYYQNWHPAQPDDCACGSISEDYLHFYLNGSWNDFLAISAPNCTEEVNYYIIEYGCMPNDPVVNTQGYVSLNVITASNQSVQAVICQGESYTLPGGSLVNTTGVYTDTLQTANGCDSIITTNLVVHTAYSNNVNAAICSGEIYTLPNGTNTALSGTYTDTLQTVNGCDSIITTNLIVSSIYSSTVSAVICSGETYTLPGGDITMLAGTYSDTLQTVNGCDSVVVTTIAVNPVYSDTIALDICNGVVYHLPDGNTTMASGVYVANLQTVNGCDSVIVTDLNVLPVYLTTVDTFICSGTSFSRPGGSVVTASGTYLDTLTAANGCDSVVATNLQHYPVYALSLTDTICQGESYSLPDGSIVSQNGVYTVNLITSNGCDSVITVTLTTVNVLLTNSVDDAKCSGSTDGSITVNAAGGVGQYTFTLSNTTIQNSTSATFYNQSAGNYGINVTDEQGCTATITAVVNEPSQVTVNMNVTDVTCFGFSDASVQLNATGGTPDYSFTLNNYSNNHGEFNSLNPGNYNYTVTDANGCQVTGGFVITEPDEVVVAITPNPVTTDLGIPVQLNATSNYTQANYEWTPPVGLSCTDCSNPTASLNNSSSYHVTSVVNINGNYCYGDTTVFVNVNPNYTVYIPNVFTPNGDGSNDYFRIFGNLTALKLVEVQIFNRWGEKVFESNDINFEWDGTYRGKLLEPQVFVYSLFTVFTDNHSEKVFKGSLTLLK